MNNFLDHMRVFKANESQHKQCGITPHLQNLLKIYGEKINIDKINWVDLFDRSTEHRYCNIPWPVNFKLLKAIVIFNFFWS